MKQILVIAPRYPERRQEIIKLLVKHHFTYAVRSQHEAVTDRTEIYLLDTMGELADFMQQAQLVFMGGSMVPRGGQNILEPARLGKAIITGPHTFTFAEDIAALLAVDAIIQVNNADDLATTLHKLVNDEALCKRLGENAKKFIASQADVLTQYMNHINTLLPESNRTA